MSKNYYESCIVKNHPNYPNGYAPKHRILMEKHLGRYLNPNEIIHHINGNKKDNRIENLKLCSDVKKHLTFHDTKGRIIKSKFDKKLSRKNNMLTIYYRDKDTFLLDKLENFAEQKKWSISATIINIIEKFFSK